MSHCADGWRNIICSCELSLILSFCCTSISWGLFAHCVWSTCGCPSVKVYLPFFIRYRDPMVLTVILITVQNLSMSYFTQATFLLTLEIVWPFIDRLLHHISCRVLWVCTLTFNLVTWSYMYRGEIWTFLALFCIIFFCCKPILDRPMARHMLWPWSFTSD